MSDIPKKYASPSSLRIFLDNIKENFALIKHKHKLEDISDYLGFTEVDIMTEHNIGPFIKNDNYGGAYMHGANFDTDYNGYVIPKFNFNIGDEFVVVWDDGVYPVTVQDASHMVQGFFAVGHAEAFRIYGNNEPFVIGWDSLGVTFFTLESTEPYHKIRIYRKVENPVVPLFTESDEGKVLTVKDGELSWEINSGEFVQGVDIIPKQDIVLTPVDTPVSETSTFSYSFQNDSDSVGLMSNLVIESTYNVEWQDNEYECVAVDVTSILSDMARRGIALGNLSMFNSNITDNGIPFVVVYMQLPDSTEQLLVGTKPGEIADSVTRTIRVFQGVNNTTVHWNDIKNKPFYDDGVNVIKYLDNKYLDFMDSSPDNIIMEPENITFTLEDEDADDPEKSIFSSSNSYFYSTMDGQNVGDSDKFFTQLMNLNAGTEYEIKIGDNIFTAVAQDISAYLPDYLTIEKGILIGNGAMYDANFPDTGESFIIAVASMTYGEQYQHVAMMMIRSTPGEDIVLECYIKEKGYFLIKESYLPDNIGSGLPEITPDDEGKVLSVKAGSVSWENASGGSNSGISGVNVAFYSQEEEPIDAPVGALWVDLDEPSSGNTYVNSINGKTGEVVLSASDVGALPDSIEIPNLDGYATEEYVDERISSIGGVQEQVQADWNQSDASEPSYIHNKPTIPSITGLATTGYVDTAVANVQVDLTGYATEEYVDNSVSGLSVENYDINIHSVNHRGYSTVAPENTIPAYILSKQNGFTYVEADVSFTSDGVAVLLHDSTIDRTSNGSGSVSLLTYSELLTYDFGSWKSSSYAGTKIPSFEKFIKLCKLISLHPYIELKSNGSYTQEQIQGLVEMVKRYGMQGKVTWISFNSTYLTYVKTADPTARLGYLVSSVTSNVITTVQGLKTETNEVFLDSSDYSYNAIELCSSANIPLEIWTINSESDIKTLDGYITGVTSDNIVAGKLLNNYWKNPDLWNYSYDKYDSNNPIIDINMNYGTNSNGLSQYNATTMSGGSFSGGKFVINGSGALTVPTEFMAGSDPWTIAFAIDSYTINTTATYCRVARGNNDVPSIFYQKSASSFLFKLASKAVFASNLVWYDNTFMSPWGTSSSNALSFNIPTSSKTVFVFMNDGTYITMWVNGSMKAKILSTTYTSEYYASTFSIGDNQSKGYNMSKMTCSMLKAWNRALSEEEIAAIA